MRDPESGKIIRRTSYRAPEPAAAEETPDAELLEDPEIPAAPAENDVKGAE
jgi:hypothetical protein